MSKQEQTPAPAAEGANAQAKQAPEKRRGPVVGEVRETVAEPAPERKVKVAERVIFGRKVRIGTVL